MGKKSSRRRNAALFDSEDDDSLSSSSTAQSDLGLVQAVEGLEIESFSLLDLSLDALSEKRAATREKALLSIIGSFKNSLQYEFLENKFVTLLHMCLSSIKRGSSKEVSLASQAIGLLALTVGYGDNSHEIYEGFVAVISQVLKSPYESLKTSSLLECLAIVTFVGSENQEETEKSKEIMWQVIHPKRGSNVVASKLSPDLVSSILSSWCFLLICMDGWNLRTQNWFDSISYISTLLEKDDRAIRMASGEAVALIFEMGSLEKPVGGRVDDLYTHILGLKSKIKNRVSDLSSEAGGKGSSKKDLNIQRNLFRDIVDFFEYDQCPETSMKIGRERVSTTTWAGLIQLNFLKRFLGGGFSKHVQENEFLRDALGMEAKRSQDFGGFSLSSKEKKVWSSNSSKRRTQMMNKKRMEVWGANVGHYAGEDDY